MTANTDLTPFEPQDIIEWRRLRAWFLFLQGWSMVHIAQALGVTCGAVSQWIKRAREHGVLALRRGKAKGGPARLTPQQRAQIPDLLNRGPEAWGFRGAVWTRERIALVLEREFNVHYHVTHISRLMKQLDWSLQKPERRSTQRDEEAILQWREKRWPDLKKKLPRKD
jgi:transposase